MSKPPVDAAWLQTSYYRYWQDEQVRYGDLDPLGHVNNVSTLQYSETVRAPFMKAVGLWRPGDTRQGVIVRHEIDYRFEITYPARLRVGLSVTHIGRSSYAVRQGIFEGERCVATVMTHIARMDTVSRRAVALTAEEQSALAGWMPHPEKESHGAE